MICRYVGFFNSFLRCVPAGVRPFPLAMQHFNSFVFKVISLLLSPRFGACIAGVRPFSAGHAALLFICFPCGLFTFVFQVRCLHCWHPPFSPFQHCYSPVSQVIWSVLSPFCFLLCPFLLVIVSALSPFLSPLSQLWAACRLQSFTLVSLGLHLSPSSGLLCPPLPCNPLHLSPSSGLLCPMLYICHHLSPSAGLLFPPLPCNP